MSRPGKHDAPVEENGRNFSGGQRQRLALARALAPTRPCSTRQTEALDTVTEAVIDDHLRRRGSTCLLVAHRTEHGFATRTRSSFSRTGASPSAGSTERLLAEDGGRYRSLVASS